MAGSRKRPGPKRRARRGFPARQTHVASDSDSVTSAVIVLGRVMGRGAGMGDGGHSPDDDCGVGLAPLPMVLPAWVRACSGRRRTERQRCARGPSASSVAEADRAASVRAQTLEQHRAGPDSTSSCPQCARYTAMAQRARAAVHSAGEGSSKRHEQGRRGVGTKRARAVPRARTHATTRRRASVRHDGNARLLPTGCLVIILILILILPVIAAPPTHCCLSLLIICCSAGADLARLCFSQH